MIRQTAMPALHRTARTVVPLCLLALAAGACTGDNEPPPADPSASPSAQSPRAGIHPRSYVRGYESGVGDSSSGTYSSLAAPAGSRASSEMPGPVPGPLEDNTFVDAGTSDFVSAEEDALSTFALDVDTGSFSVARTLLRQGELPPPASIRVEEWVNALSMPPAAPTDEDLAVDVQQAAQSDARSPTQLLRVGVSARDIADADRPPVALTLVVDTSGSMDIRQRLGLVKSSLALLAQTLRDDDTIAVVTYEDRATALLEATPVSDTDAILEAIDDLRPGGSTNVEAGLRTGYREARAHLRAGALNVVLLASDGVANVGTTSGSRLAGDIAQAGDDGIHLVTVGYGMGNYNDHLMEQLADQGDGFYAYVDTFAEAERLFVEDLTSTLTVVADDARAQVTFDEATVESYRLVGYDNRAVADDEFTDRDLDAGEIGAGHQVTALYEVRLAPGATAGDPMGSVALRWLSAADGSVQQSTTELTLDDTAGAPDELRLASLVADLAEVLKGSDQVAARGVTLAQLAERAERLRLEGVAEAEQVATLVEQAQGADAGEER
jgi:Ca-activated chloride channel family protein